jgi:glycosyltransferase involved in cell wall biosynthesis
MNLTVVLCTYNRCESLARALESVARSIVPVSLEWEVLIVDNNSRDDTRAVAERFGLEFPGRFRYIFEPQQGKSYALNRAISQSRGEVIAFMDDDVEVDAQWLHRLTSPLSDQRWSGSGGRILPDAGFAPPRWLDTAPRYALAPFAIFDLGKTAGELKEPPFGTNMAFRKTMFSKYGGFRTDLGPQPGSEIRSEDTEFGARLLSGGERFWYEASAVVYHPVQPERVRKQYLLKWHFDKGRADIREYGSPGRPASRIFGVPIVFYRRFCVWATRWVCGITPKQRFSGRQRVWGIAGMIKECRAQTVTGTRSTRTVLPTDTQPSQISRD